MTHSITSRFNLIAAVITAVLCVASSSHRPAFAQLTPAAAAQQMGRGINLGNTLEPPTEGGWNNGPAQEYYFDEYVDAGFRNVRIPIRWDQHTSNSVPFTVAESWMNRVEQIIDWALQRNLFVIINSHHEDWLKQNYADVAVQSRFDSIWGQIAERFQNKSEKLLFEIINEPYGLTRQEVDGLNERILAIIRQSNPTRIVIFSGNEYSNVDQLLSAAIPNDPYIMAYFHSYDPWNFAGLGNGTWGTVSDRNALHQHIGRVVNWSTNNGVPVIDSEFGAVHATDYNSRMRYFAAYVEELISAGIPFQVWDDGGNFEVMKRTERDWHDSKDILINTYPDGPTNFQVSAPTDSTVKLTWTNRATQNSIVIERAPLTGQFSTLAEITSSATTFTDETASPGVTYRYRIIGKNVLMGDRYSHPLAISLPASQSSFFGAPFPIPGTIEAEDFDAGGQFIAYFDSDAVNTPGAYRPESGVDIQSRDGGGFQISYVNAGEWLEYTVDVATAGSYTLAVEVASLIGGGYLLFRLGNVVTPRLRVPATGDWQTTTSIESQMELEAGEQILRMLVYSLPEFNIDRVVIQPSTVTSVEKPSLETGLEIYPNPARGFLTIETGLFRKPTEISVFDILGRRVHQETLRGPRHVLDIQDLPTGQYTVVLKSQGQIIDVAPFISHSRY